MKAATLTFVITGSLLAGSVCLLALPHVRRSSTQEEGAGVATDQAAIKPGKSPGSALARGEGSGNAGEDPEATAARVHAGIGEAREQLLKVCATGNVAERYRNLAKLFDRYSSADYLDAAEALITLGFGPESKECLMLLSAWVEREPERALTELVNSPRQEILPPLIRAWAESDPKAALAWIETTKPEQKIVLQNQVVSVLMRRDPAAAKALLESMPPDQQGVALYSIVPRDLGLRDRAGLQAWIDALPAALRQQALGLMLQSLPGSRTAEKLEWMQRYPSLASPGPVNHMYADWIRSDEAAALSSIETLDKPELREAAYEGISRTYLIMGKEKESFEAMQRSTPEYNEERLELWLTSPRNGAPLVALEQITNIRDESRRKPIYRRLLSDWQEADPKAAKEWMNTHEIPEDVRKALEER
ncbi:hypothetical protein OJ996_17460 [Luteolibacter sp. GHJ8]|uniref:HEAT repeat domain-containing protein n=1 Tax=Luteolibacter rhizosphaerae TaxID=2989719 RepID=A0ABT3G7B8_9BACT|nr:hypothetical protein [Luteolibacter rhizosphaerae]MCW1915376.1 hypothetical protein [Luteolibacter rhizosphaerae]